MYIKEQPTILQVRLAFVYIYFPTPLPASTPPSAYKQRRTNRQDRIDFLLYGCFRIDLDSRTLKIAFLRTLELALSRLHSKDGGTKLEDETTSYLAQPHAPPSALEREGSKCMQKSGRLHYRSDWLLYISTSLVCFLQSSLPVPADDEGDDDSDTSQFQFPVWLISHLQ